MQLTLLPNILFSCLILILLASCNDRTKNEPFGTSIINTMSEKEISHKTRAFTEYEPEEVLVRFTVIYNGDFTQMTTDDNSPFKALLETYNLEIQKPFDIDKENKGFILVPTIPLAAPVEVGKEISLIEEVLMVEVGNATKEESNPS